MDHETISPLLRVPTLLVLILLGSLRLLSAQALEWTQVTGTMGGNVEAIAFESECVIYVATVDTGLHKTNDCGDSWEYLGFRRINGAAANITGVMIDEDGNVFISINSRGIKRSEDGGQSWTDWNAGLPLDQYDCLEEGINGRPSVCTRGFGILELIDGNTWSTLPTTNLGGADIRGLGKNDSLLVIGTFGRDGVYSYTIDFGAEEVLGNGLDTNLIRDVAVDSNLVLAASFGRGVRAVDLEDLNWYGITEDLPSSRFHSVYAHKGLLYVGSDGFGAYSKTRDETEWTHSLDDDISVFAFAHSPGDRIYAGANNGLYQQGDNGTFSLLGPAGGPIRSLSTFDGAIYTGLFDGGVYKSSTDSSPWSRSLSEPQSIFTLHNHADQMLLAGTFEKGVYKLMKGSDEWEDLGLRSRQVHDFVVRPNGDIIASTKSGVHRKVSNEDSWQSLGLGPLIIRNLHLTSDNRLFAFSASNDEAQIYSYDDSQAQWTSLLPTPLDAPIWTTEITNLDRVVFSYPPKGVGVYDLNSGALNTFQDPSSDIIDIELVNDSTWIAAALSGKIFRTDDSGENWTELGIASEDIFIRSMIVDDQGRIVVGSETAGVWLSQEGVVEVSNKAETPLSESRIIELYPNPSSGLLTANFEDTRSREYFARIYSTLGKELLQLPGRSALGSNSIEMDTSELARGAYLLSIEFTDGSTALTKLLFRN